MKIKCPVCSKEYEEEEFRFEWHPKDGRRGKCPNPKCKAKLSRSIPALGLVRNASGQLVRSAGRRKK